MTGLAEQIACIDTAEALDYFGVGIPDTCQLTAYVANLPGIRLQFVRIDSHVLPLLINDEVCDTCYLVSAKAQYVDYALAEVRGLKHPVVKRLMAVFSVVLPVLAKNSHLDRLIIIGGWLLPTNPALNLTDGQLMGLIDFLKRAYPKHAYVVKNIDALRQQEMLTRLPKLGFSLQLSREIHWFDPKSSLTKKHRQNIQRDYALLDQTGYTIADEVDVTDADVALMHQLYTSLYINKNSPLNAAYTPAWFRFILVNRLMAVRCLRDVDRTLIGFVFYGQTDDVIHPQIVGYDLNRVNNQSPYRPLVASLIRDARLTNRLVFLSSGVASFKKNRGTQTYYEYDAIYNAHLSFSNRMFWKALNVIYRNVAAAVYSENII